MNKKIQMSQPKGGSTGNTGTKGNPQSGNTGTRGGADGGGKKGK